MVSLGSLAGGLALVLRGGEGELLLEVPAEGVGVEESALVSHVGDGEVVPLCEELCGVGQAAVVEEVDKRLVGASLGEGCSYALFRESEAVAECLPVELGVEEELVLEDGGAELLVELGVGRGGSLTPGPSPKSLTPGPSPKERGVVTYDP